MQRNALVLSLVFGAVGAMPAHAQVWIEYTVTGAVSLEHREDDVVMCSLTDEAFLVHTIGEWNISIETDSNQPGEHAATFMVAAPDSIAVLKDPRLDGRPKGKGTVVIEDGGTSEFGFPRVTVTFEAAGLVSDAGKSIDITGRLACDVM